MRIIKKGNTIKECSRCGCTMEYDYFDIFKEIKNVTTSNFFGTFERWEIEYIFCPECGNKIEVGHKCLK